MLSAVQTSSNAIGTFLKGFATSARTVAQAGPAAEQSVRTVDQVGDNQRAQTELAQDTAQPQTPVGARVTEGREGSGNDTDLDDAAVQMTINKTGVQGSVAVIKTADRMIGSLLDVVG